MLSSTGKSGRNKKVKPMPNQHVSEEQKEKVNKRKDVGLERKTEPVSIFVVRAEI